METINPTKISILEVNLFERKDDIFVGSERICASFSLENLEEKQKEIQNNRIEYVKSFFKDEFPNMTSYDANQYEIEFDIYEIDIV